MEMLYLKTVRGDFLLLFSPVKKAHWDQSPKADTPASNLTVSDTSLCQKSFISPLTIPVWAHSIKSKN